MLTETKIPAYIVEAEDFKLTELDIACLIIRAIHLHQQDTPVGVSNETIHGLLRCREYISIDDINSICEKLKGNTILVYCQETNKVSNEVDKGWKLTFAR